MHELSIAVNVVGIAAEASQRLGLGEIVAVHLKLGALSGVVKEALLSAFEVAREDSVLENATLRIEEVPVVIFCRACSGESTVGSIQSLCCTRCGNFSGEIVRGRELEIVSLEVRE